MLLERYREFLPITDRTPLLTLNEGNTPLIAAPRLAAALGVRELHLKFEGLNPSGSFKDRGMAHGRGQGARGRRDLDHLRLDRQHLGQRRRLRGPRRDRGDRGGAHGKIALGKLAQALMYGARLLVIDGNFDAALQIVCDLSDRYAVTLVNSVNPHRIEGQTTAAYEICDTLGGAPDALCLPVGNAGNITAYWLGFKRYHAAGKIARRPRMLGFQAEGSAPIVRGAPVAHPETVATAIRIGNPASWQGATAARDESGGIIDAVSDEQIIAAWRDLARLEGVFCEPASAAGVAGLRMLIEQGRAERDARYVAVLTGHGLKDPGLAVEQFAAPQPVSADLGAIVKWLGW